MEKFTGTPEDITSPEMAAMLRHEATEYASPLHYTRSLASRYRYLPVHTQLLTQFASVVEPYDRILGQDETMPTARAFYLGGLLALRVAERAGDDVLFALSTDDVMIDDVDEEDDFAEKLHQLAASILEVGSRGYGAAPVYAPLFEGEQTGWQNELAPDVRHQKALRAGFGLVMYMADKAVARVRAEQMEAMAAVIDDGCDWDAALKKLLTSQD